MDIFEKSTCFSKWIDPVSQVVSYVLTHRGAPVQQSFYFTNQACANNGSCFWFYCAFPPSGDHNYGRQLGVMDIEDDEMRIFPETSFSDGSPMVDGETGEVYWVSGLDIWKRGPKRSQHAEKVCSFPTEIAKGRRPHRVATHLTFSADKKTINIDTMVGREWYVGDISLKDGKINIWQQFDRCYNHGQFNPIDPDLQMIAQDHWIDCLTGEQLPYEKRIWTIRRGEQAKPVFPRKTTSHGHEWWDADGKHIWYVDYNQGTARVNLETGEKGTVWANGTCHSHSDKSGKLLTGDIGTYNWASGCRVAFYDVEKNREINIVSSLPLPPLDRRSYHLDPHPQFCLQDQFIMYTTTVLGYVTVAAVSVDSIRAIIK